MNLGRVISAMVTPMDKDYRVDYQAAQHLAEHLITHGSDSLVVSGTTGESPTLSKEEKLKLFAAVKEVAQNRFPVIAGTSSYDTAESVAMSKEAVKVGADAILAVTPYYNKPPQEGAYQHFKAIAEAVDVPVILYNVPSRTQFNLLPQTVGRLAKIENIVATKEATGNMDQMSELKREVPDDFLIYSGDDSATLPMLALGGHGVISVAAQLVGEQIQQMIQAFVAGDAAKAQQLHSHLYPVFRKIFLVANPIPLKYCLNQIGLNVGPCRLPLVEADAAVKAELDQLLKDFALHA